MSKRTTVIREQREQHGRQAVAVLPIYYPKELLTALDLLAVELWGPPGPPRGAQVGRLQAYVCAVARNALAFIAEGGAEDVAAFLFPHTCDSIQGLATQLPDMGGARQPALRYRIPKGEPRPSARAYVRRELEHLADGLAAVAGRPLDPDRLRWALSLHQEIDACRAALLDGRARVDLSDRELYELLRRGEYLWSEDHLAELRPVCERLAQTDTAVQTGVPLLLSGIVPEPMALLDHLAEAGAYVGGDDFAAVGRRVVRQAPDPEGDPLVSLDSVDPLDRLTDRMLAAPPCSTRAATLDGRLAHLDRILRTGGCQGVVLQAVQFCEPELFDVAGLRQHFTEREVPFLVLDSELEAELAGRAVTRLEAFVEMMAERQAGAGAGSVPGTAAGRPVASGTTTATTDAPAGPAAVRRENG